MNRSANAHPSAKNQKTFEAGGVGAPTLWCPFLASESERERLRLVRGEPRILCSAVESENWETIGGSMAMLGSRRGPFHPGDLRPSGVRGPPLSLPPMGARPTKPAAEAKPLRRDKAHEERSVLENALASSGPVAQKPEGITAASQGFGSEFRRV
ncbi:hypothetical protein AK812_SmicGene2982 [Symbiodinium microadriaticum]|uniref:Uncharacterized protein n=1 Tax=Symbiodinium microadriaticum TaxID=2951 RepID=A0A1Q9F0B6_SYMMI|nr:hypothetical protein AK812_SmicGene2982 [Symbiodinium microadriaticum]